MVDFMGLVVIAALAALFGYLAWRAFGSKRKILKWVGLVLAGLLTLIFGLAFILAVVGTIKLNQNYNADHPVVELQGAATADQAAWGEKYAIYCAGCHAANNALPLSGNDFLGGGGGIPPIGTLYAPNLTPAGEIKDWTDGEVVRAIREGVHKNGRSLIIMPAQIFHNLSDEDVKGLVAYLRSQPATTPDTPQNSLNVLGAILVTVLGSGIQTVQPHITQAVVAPPQNATAERGKYVLAISGCTQCHGENLAGGVPGAGPPPGPNLTAVVPKWTEADFVKTIRTGVDPTGHVLTDAMPWQAISNYTSDDDLKGLYAYLHGLPELPSNK